MRKNDLASPRDEWLAARKAHLRNHRVQRHDEYETSSISA
jgi:hypothetical protein